MTQFTTGHLTARIAFQMIALQLALGITIPTPQCYRKPSYAVPAGVFLCLNFLMY